MRTLFIPAYTRVKVNKERILEDSKKLPKNIALVYSIQFKKQAEEIKQILSEAHNITKFSQVLGCSKLTSPRQTQAVLLIGEGRFHALGIALETDLPIYVDNLNKLEKITEQETKEFKQKNKAAKLKYLNADKAGILISTKPGQNNLKKALKFREQSKKKSYLFISNNINVAEFENFPQIQAWVNTACRRMDMNDASIINLDKIQSEF